MLMSQFGIFTTAFAVLVIVVNIITQVLKSFTIKKEIPTRIIALAVSVFLTVSALIAACQIYSIKIVWYLIVAAIVVGFIVAYCAIFGYDNLYSELKKLLQKLFETDK